MEVVSRIAPEVDRLVLATNARVSAEHRERITEIAASQGVPSTALISMLGKFMAAGTLTRAIAVQRLRYMPPELLEARLNELQESGNLQQVGEVWQADPRLVAVIEAHVAATAEVAASAWAGHEETVEAVSMAARHVADAASPEHGVAVAHRDLPEGDDPYGRLHHRLITLRFIRQHDHAAAWLSRGFTAPEMQALTGLWKGAEVEPDTATETLATRGLISADPLGLSPDGQIERDEIEAETNRRNAGTWAAALSDDEAEEMLAGLRRLPGQT